MALTYFSAMKIQKLHSILHKTLIVATMFLLICCGGSTESENICTKTCPKDYYLDKSKCECIKEPCKKVCESGFLLNVEKCECEEIFVHTTIEVDASTATLNGDWKKRTDIPGYSGGGYIVWEGAPQFWKGDANIGNAGRLTYKINIVKTGVYLFQWRTYIAKKDPAKPTTEHNDSWLRFPDANDFYAIKGTSKLYPKGSGKTPNPLGENGNGFFKVYMNTADAWSQISSTSDNDAHQIYVKFTTAKEYTVEIAARSEFHAIDSFKLIELVT